MRLDGVRTAVRIHLAQSHRGRQERSQALLVQRKALLELRERVRTNLRAMYVDAAAKRRTRQRS
jgi:hypothetical protein